MYPLIDDDGGLREQARFDDSIGIFPEFIDGYGVLILPTTGRYYQVPYRSLVPKRIGNLIVAGRSKREIVPVLRARLANTREAELRTGLDEFLAIALDRLERPR